MSFEERLKQYSLTKTDRCIAEYCLQNMEGLPLSSSAEIARQVNTSDVSVIRFVTKLGYKNFVEFKHEIQHELVQSQASLEEVSPIVRYISNHADDPTLVSGLDQMESYYQSSLSLIFHKNPPAVFEQAARLVLAASNRYVLGIRFRESIADLCSNLLRLSVPNVIHIPASDYKAFQISRDMSKDDCLIWFNFDQFTNFEEQMLSKKAACGSSWCLTSGLPRFLWRRMCSSSLPNITSCRSILP